MARRIDPVCRLCRREGMKLFLKGERCYSPKCSFEKRNYAPGMHGKKGTFKRKESDFATQLREKQRARRIYGVQERQFRRYFRNAQHVKGMTGVTLLVDPGAPAGQRGVPHGPGGVSPTGASIGAPRAFQSQRASP